MKNITHHIMSLIFFVNIVLLLILLIKVEQEIVYLAYATIISTALAILWQFQLIFKRINARYRLIFYCTAQKEVIKSSIKLKIGSLLYGGKDMILASVFTSYGAGMYTLFSYARKFSSIIIQVVNAPIINIFAAKANNYVADSKFKILNKKLKVQIQIIPLFFLLQV